MARDNARDLLSSSGRSSSLLVGAYDDGCARLTRALAGNKDLELSLAKNLLADRLLALDSVGETTPERLEELLAGSLEAARLALGGQGPAR